MTLQGRGEQESVRVEGNGGHKCWWGEQGAGCEKGVGTCGENGEHREAYGASSGSQRALALSERHLPGKALDQVCRTVSQVTGQICSK